MRLQSNTASQNGSPALTRLTKRSFTVSIKGCDSSPSNVYFYASTEVRVLQITTGVCNSIHPEDKDKMSESKWIAWKSASALPKEQAAKNFIVKVAVGTPEDLCSYPTPSRAYKARSSPGMRSELEPSIRPRPHWYHRRPIAELQSPTLVPAPSVWWSSTRQGGISP